MFEKAATLSSALIVPLSLIIVPGPVLEARKGPLLLQDAQNEAPSGRAEGAAARGPIPTPPVCRFALVEEHFWPPKPARKGPAEALIRAEGLIRDVVYILCGSVSTWLRLTVKWIFRLIVRQKRQTPKQA